MMTSRSKVPASAVSSPTALPAGASPVRLSDAAVLLLGQAATRPDRMILPPPATVRARGGALQKVLQALLKTGLVAEVPAAEPAQGWRQDEGGRPIGLAITPEGFRAIGLPVPEPEPEPEPASEPKATVGSGAALKPRPKANSAKAAAPTADAPAPACVELPGGTEAAASEPKRDTKQARLVSLLSGEDGHSVPSLAAALSWQNHTVRAALTGLRQKGHDLVKLRDAEGATVYRIARAGHAVSGTAPAVAPGA